MEGVEGVVRGGGSVGSSERVCVWWVWSVLCLVE